MLWFRTYDVCHGVNTPTITGFKLPTWCLWVQILEEMCIVGCKEPGHAASAHPWPERYGICSFNIYYNLMKWKKKLKIRTVGFEPWSRYLLAMWTQASNFILSDPESFWLMYLNLFFLKINFIGVLLLYNVVLAFTAQQNESAIHIQISPPFWTSFPFRLPQCVR